MKRRQRLGSKIHKEKITPHTKIIGIVGTHLGVGVTHTGLMIAYYLGGVVGDKTAFVECNSSGDMSRLKETYQWSKEESDCFTFYRTTCYENVSKGRLTDILLEGYQWIIIDFGVEWQDMQEELAQCNMKLIVGSGAPWHQNKLVLLGQKYLSLFNKEDWRILMPYTRKDIRKRVQEAIGLSKDIEEVPFDVNPLDSTKEIAEFMYVLGCW